MSYNTSNISFLSGALYITDKKLKKFEKKHDYPTSDIRMREVDDGKNQILHIPSGECTLNHLLPEFLAMTEGKADLLVIWEGGDSVSGLRVEDGVVEKMDVEYVLKKVKS